MYGTRPAWKDQPPLMHVVRGMAAGGIFLTLWLLGGTAQAAPPAISREAVMLTFTATIQSGAVPSDVLFWLCADPQPDGTGCFEMSSQPDGSYLYQLATATGISYHQLEIVWTRGSRAGVTATPSASPNPTTQPSAPPLPVLPLHTLCPYPALTVSGPKSFTCQVDATLFTITPTPGTAAPTPTNDPGTPPQPSVDRDTATLITGLQVIIGVGLVLLVILLSILIWQRATKRRR